MDFYSFLHLKFVGIDHNTPNILVGPALKCIWLRAFDYDGGGDGGGGSVRLNADFDISQTIRTRSTDWNWVSIFYVRDVCLSVCILTYEWFL